MGAEMFFSSRGTFNRPPGQTTSNRASGCPATAGRAARAATSRASPTASIWQFDAGPRKSVPLNATFNPHNPTEQRVLNYSAIFDEVEDFEANIRNVSGPGALAAALPCTTPPPRPARFDPNHGLLIGDNGDINVAPCVVNSLREAERRAARSSR